MNFASLILLISALLPQQADHKVFVPVVTVTLPQSCYSPEPESPEGLFQMIGHPLPRNEVDGDQVVTKIDGCVRNNTPSPVVLDVVIVDLETNVTYKKGVDATPLQPGAITTYIISFPLTYAFSLSWEPSQ